MHEIWTQSVTPPSCTPLLFIYLPISYSQFSGIFILTTNQSSTYSSSILLPHVFYSTPLCRPFPHSNSFNPSERGKGRNYYFLCGKLKNSLCEICVTLTRDIQPLISGIYLALSVPGGRQRTFQGRLRATSQSSKMDAYVSDLLLCFTVN